MLRRVMTWLAILALTVSAGLPLAAGAQEAGAPLNVVTTFSILDDLVRNVGGDTITTHALVGAGVDSHTYEPAPADVGTLAEADLVFEIGLDYEPWLEGIYESSGSSAPRIVVTENVPPLPFVEGEEHAEDEHAEDEHAEKGADHDEAEHEEAHEHGTVDPHVWHDVSNAIIMVETIRDALIEADPDNAATYEANATAYIAELAALDGWVQEQINTLPEDQRKLVTSHEALGHFAHRYGLEVVGTAFGTLSTESGDPSAADIAQLVATIQEQQVNAIFAENVSNPDLMESIAAEAGVTLAPTLFTDSLGAPGSGGETYIGLIESNTNAIVSALGGE